MQPTAAAATATTATATAISNDCNNNKAALIKNLFVFAFNEVANVVVVVVVAAAVVKQEKRNMRSCLITILWRRKGRMKKQREREREGCRGCASLTSKLWASRPTEHAHYMHAHACTHTRMHAQTGTLLHSHACVCSFALHATPHFTAPPPLPLLASMTVSCCKQ